VEAVVMAFLVPVLLMAATLGLARIEAVLPPHPRRAAGRTPRSGHPTGVMPRHPVRQRLDQAPRTEAAEEGGT
jgi:hypothetical protein